MKPKIQEIIIVEGRDDISAVKAAVDAEIIQVNGFAIRKKGNIDKIKKAYENKGIILLTDPDYAGNEIRSFLQQHFPKAKNAYISRSEGKKGEDIGVENAKPEAILRALQLAKCNIEEEENSFSMQFLYDLHLVGHPKSSTYRELFTSLLGIGYSNGKQLLSKLNRYGFSEQEILEAHQKMKEEYEKQNS
ncbi:ribonuclease M5 [Fusobacterium necrophorum]|uniref:Ribonuclease M5 n=1 Tax=Fusobacterium necrophorum TaxID=859 RepID=A0A4Q2KV72_9FUSO|nr:ribonuclease M5 [Fusobacterium necrophorum]RXZ68799.1 ribonuclease M5 [Fusobacterium necrophorum]